MRQLATVAGCLMFVAAGVFLALTGQIFLIVIGVAAAFDRSPKDFAPLLNERLASARASG